MTKRAPALAASALALVSCARTVQETSIRVPVSSKPAPKYSVSETMRRQVRNAVDAGEGDLRIKSIRQHLATNPDDLKSRLELARHYAEAGFPDVALEHYRIAASRYPDSAEVAVLLARTLESIGLPVDAKAHLQGFLASHPASWQALSWLGIFQDRVQEYPQAELSHREAIKLHAGSDALHNNLGYNLLLQGKHTEAAEEFRKALELAPGSSLARNNLGIALAGQPAEAVGQWQSVTDPATAHSNLAAVLIERGDYKAARRELEVALGYKKDHPAALSNLQLISELDGGDVGLPPGMLRSPWHRFVRGLGVVLFGEPVDSGRVGAGPAAGPDAKRKQAVRTAGED